MDEAHEGYRKHKMVLEKYTESTYVHGDAVKRALTEEEEICTHIVEL